MVVIPSTLDAVTVHAEGALCTRLAAVPSDNGRLPRQVRIEGLPLGLRTGSLRASVQKGPHTLRVQDIRPVFDVRLPQEVDISTAQRALEEAQEKLSSLASEMERVQRDIAALQKLKPSFPPYKKDVHQEPRESALTAILSLAGFVDTELSTLLAQQIDLERQHREAMEEVELRRRRLEEGSSAVRGQRAQLYRAAVITLSEVDGTHEGAQLALEYVVHGARWVPGYDLRLPRTLDGGTLLMRASIIQRTGEDWSNVRMSLSTAQLERRADVPELKALRIGRRQPPPARSGWREPPPGLDELFAGYDTARPASPPRPPPGSPAPEPAPKPQAVMEEPSRPSRPSLPAFAPPPPPARVSQSMPALAAPAAPMAAARPTGSFRSPAPGGAPPAPAPSAPPPALKRSSNMMRSGDLSSSGEMRRSPSVKEEAPESEAMDLDGALSFGEGSGGAFGSPPFELAGELVPAGDLLDYGSLELGAADQPAQRGRLRPQPEAMSRELLMLMGVHVRVDVFALMAQYENTAASVQHVAPPAWSVPPRQATQHFDYRFDVETRVDVPSDGVWHTVPVFSAPVGLSAQYVCVPSMEPRAFRTLKVENRTPHALLAGPVDITLGDEFLMTSPLPTLAPGATQQLGLGVEESIKVSRNTRFDEVSGGMFSNSNLLTHHVSVELANRTQQRVTVEVLERVPVVPSAEKDIKVEESEVQPAWSKRTLLPGETPVEGERAWKVTLQPGETQTLSATWAVRIPSSKMLVGGNRRT
ncbi:mucoidy inhibitor MuiA family protein [Archangium violaceum]|uniref:mucoidy inhibitor MuiA family protein n=1 Tax=Archangium violaceum TaxID=83451 RepID=UPI002B31B52A|nr:mucoidy inhibitor MuiA family protein [Archangium violaceum]